MPVCKTCHTRMSKAKWARHHKNCVPEKTKGFEHYKDCRSYTVDPVTKKRVKGRR